jgi:hypothetical protein
LLLAGVALDALGALLIVLSFPEMDLRFAGGILALVAGGVLIFAGTLQRVRSAAAQKPAAPAEARDWQPEPELRSPIPRRVVLSRAGKRLSLLWAVLTLAVPGYVYFALSRVTTHAGRYLYDYVEVAGVIHDKKVRDGVPGKTHYLYYGFQSHGGVERRASIRVAEPVYEAFEVGDSVKVVYLPQNPDVHELPELAERPGRPPALGVSLAMAAVLLLLYEMIRRKHRHLTADGSTVRGVVDTVRRRGSRYIYTSKCTVGGKERVLRGTESERPLKLGDAVTVLYLPQKPEQTLIYRLSMYQAAPPSG